MEAGDQQMEIRSGCPQHYELAEDGKLYVAHLIGDIWKASGGGAIVTTDVGQHANVDGAILST